jgi:serine protease AprX
VAIVPNAALERLAGSPFVEQISLDRVVVGAMERTGHTVGAAAVRDEHGYDGAGVGVAIIDSGITAWHDDLTDGGVGQRVAHFVDFVGSGETAYDDYGHGTHVAGIVAGNGFDSDGARTGIAPRAHIIALKVLDGTGTGYISDVISAIDYVIANKSAFNIRIINLSVAAGVYESYWTDPLTLAAQRATQAGIVVVAAGGNNGRSPEGRMQYGGVTAPGNAPWVLTVGSSSHMGTIDRGDDSIAAFSSRGPTAIDFRAKPDLVAPGVGIESLAAPDSALYSSSAPFLLSGTRPTPYLPYLSRSGTSMSAPVVTGTVALMLQANPALTANAVKAILQYTAETSPGSDPLTQGAGYLNARGAIELARHLAAGGSAQAPDMTRWSRGLIWGNRLVEGGELTADANAWPSNVTWGASYTPDGRAVSWGLRCNDAACSSTNGRWRLENAPSRNVVWGSICGGNNCSVPWTFALVSSASDGETVVWGTADDGETVVWGTTDGETVVWGTAEGETVVWGTSCSDPSCAPVIWGAR